MLRRFWAVIGILLALGLVLAGLVIPARFQAVPPELLEEITRSGAGIEERLQVFLRRGQVGPAEEFIQAMDLLGLDTTAPSVKASELLQENPGFVVSGGPSPYFDAFLKTLPKLPKIQGEAVPVAAILASNDARSRLEGFLETSSDPTVQAILETRTLTGWNRLYPVDVPGGAALDIASLTTALLAQSGAFPEEILLVLDHVCTEALSGDREAMVSLERTYLAVLAASGRYNWLTLKLWVESTSNLNGLARITPWLREAEQPALLYTAVILTQDPVRVAIFLEQYPEKGWEDLQQALLAGSGGLDLLLDGPKPIYRPGSWHDWLPPVPQKLTELSLKFPAVARGTVIVAWLLAGILLAISLKALLWGKARVHERPVIEVCQDFILAGCLLLGLIVLSEPELLNQRVTEPGKLFLEFELKPETTTLAESTMDISSIDQVTLIVLLIFLVVQLMIYTGCLVKLGQVKRAPVSASVRLKLLENEENLFDAGLYVGLSGTVISLLMLALGVVQASLVAAYASTLFGIIFVATLKIFHVRPLRRKLILEADRIG